MANKKIYGFFNSTREFGYAEAIAIDEDGVIVATHICSNEAFAGLHLGMTGGSERKHNLYNEAYPDGWETEFVHMRKNRDKHEGLNSALRKRENWEI